MNAHHEHERHPDDTTHLASSPAHYPQHHHEHTQADDDSLLDDSLLESLNLGHDGPQSTPRAPPPSSSRKPKWADIDSPFSAVQRELTSHSQRQQPDESSASSSRPAPPPTSRYLLSDSDSDHDGDDDFDDDPALGDDATRALPPAPQTPRSVRRPARRNRHAADSDDSDDGSPVMPDITTQLGQTPRTGGKGPLLHRVLDTKWRLQATPMGKPAPSRYLNTTVGQQQQQKTPARGRLDFGAPSPSGAYDRTLSSSPPEPELRTMVFTPKAQRAAAGFGGGASTARGGFGASAAAAAGGNTTIGGWDEEDSDELILPPGFSPPKTMQFSIAPSKLMATPAKQASQMIVRDILQTAGASYDDEEDTEELEAEESMRRRAKRVERQLMDDDDDIFSSPVRGGGLEDDDPF